MNSESHLPSEQLRSDRLAARVVELSQKPGVWLRRYQEGRAERTIAKLYSAATAFVVSHGIEATPVKDHSDIEAKPTGVAFVYNNSVVGPADADPYEATPALAVSFKRRKWFRRREATKVTIEVAPHLAEAGFASQEGKELNYGLSAGRAARLCNRASRLLTAATVEHRQSIEQAYPASGAMPVLLEAIPGSFVVPQLPLADATA